MDQRRPTLGTSSVLILECSLKGESLASTTLIGLERSGCMRLGARWLEVGWAARGVEVELDMH